MHSQIEARQFQSTIQKCQLVIAAIISKACKFYRSPASSRAGEAAPSSMGSGWEAGKQCISCGKLASLACVGGQVGNRYEDITDRWTK